MTNLHEAALKIKLKTLAKKLGGIKDASVKKIIQSLEKGTIPSKDIKKLKGDLQDNVVMAMAEVLGPEETTKALGEEHLLEFGAAQSEETVLKEFKVKTVKVGEDAVGADEPHYALVKEREVIAVGSKQDMLTLCKEQGGRVWLTAKGVGDLVEERPVNYTLGNKPDRKHVYTVKSKDGFTGKRSSHGTYHSLGDAQRVVANQKKTNTIDKFKIKRKPRPKLAGPKGKLPEEVQVTEAKVEKIACAKCDAVATRNRWKKNGGTCPNCNKSSQGYRVESALTADQAEQLVEISKELAGRYLKKSAEMMKRHAHAGGSFKGQARQHSDEYADAKRRGDEAAAKRSKENHKFASQQSLKDRKTADKRQQGINRAVNRLTREDVEQVDELKKSTLVNYISKSANDSAMSAHSAGANNNKKDYKTAVKRIKGIQRASRLLAKEDVERIIEISQQLKKRYIKKATKSLAHSAMDHGQELSISRDYTGSHKDAMKQSSQRTLRNRMKGIRRAVEELVHEAVDKEAQQEQKLKNLRRRLKDAKGGRQKTDLEKQIAELEKQMGELSQEKKKEKGRQYVSSTEKGDTHIIGQLRAAQDWKGNVEIQFRRGPKKKVPLNDINFVLKLHDALNPEGKRRLRIQASQSYQELQNIVKTYKSRFNESVEYFNEEGGAGEWGTNKLRKKYEDDTPGQSVAREALEIDGDEGEVPETEKPTSKKKKKEGPSPESKDAEYAKNNSKSSCDEDVSEATRAGGVSGTSSRKTIDTWKSPEGDEWVYDEVKTPMGSAFRTITKISQGGRSTMNKYGGYSAHSTGAPGYTDRKWKELKSRKTKNVRIGEETELTEKLLASDPIDKWISDFVASSDPKFEGKSKDERIKMAKGAWYAAQKGDN